MTTKLIYGGTDVLFPDLTWTHRPNFAGSGAPDKLCDAWTATMLALRDVRGAVRSGSCHYINLAARPLAEAALGEPVQACAGFAAFVSRAGRFECGFRWRPSRWSDWIDASEGAHLSPIADIHCWMETRTHVVDFSTGDTMADPHQEWPALIYWPKWQLPKHPREAKYKPETPLRLLLWRDAEALAMVSTAVAPIIAPITKAALDIYAGGSR